MHLLILLGLILLAGCESASVIDRDGHIATVPTMPFGAWPSPITAASTIEGSRYFHSLAYDGNYLYWVEERPEEEGRATIVRWIRGGEVEDLLPPPWNVRSRVHEYGGLSMLVAGGVIWFTNFDDQRVYRMEPGGIPEAVTPESDLRYVGCTLDSLRDRLLCIREDHRGDGEPINTLVAIGNTGETEGKVLFDASDFVSAPTLSADNSQLAFVSWNHPNMPWDNTTLWTAGFNEAGELVDLFEHNPSIAESVIDPQWDDNNQLYVLSDRNNWWTLYTVEGVQFSELNTGLVEVEIGGADWTMGRHYYRILPGGHIVAQVVDQGVEQAYLLDPEVGLAKPINLGSAGIGDLLPVNDDLYVVNYPARRPGELVVTGLPGQDTTIIRKSRDHSLGIEWVPEYQLVNFPSAGGTLAHGIYTPPKNPNVTAPEKAAPPLIVFVHGGPTAVFRPVLSITNLYWTSRGFAVLDLNYRGSTGFGREYRQALYGNWGVADVEDAIAGATWLVEEGLADPQRLIISGESAGGYTTLAALALHEVFKAGASYAGVSNVEALTLETHKFESRYLGQLIGPYPERRDLYVDRSPINHLDDFNAPLLLLQGLKDPIVSPDQSEKIFEALKSRGVPTAYVVFEDEYHGFLKSENMIRALEAELYFYSRVLDFKPADNLERLNIIGLDPESP